MTTVSETIPDHLTDRVDAALAWWNAEQDVVFEVTGIVDPDDGGRDLRLVLCGGDRCEQRSFRLDGERDAWSISLVDDESAAPTDAAVVPELDPPPGARREWLARNIEQHEFVVLVFYRGFW